MRKVKGFTLIELSIVLVILSVMLGGILSAIAQDNRRIKLAELKVKMDAIEEALLVFRKKNGRLPCPATLSLDVTHNNFGKEASVPGTCDGAIDSTFRGAPTDPPYDVVTPPDLAYLSAGGGVPVHTLGIPDEYAFDSWGGRFVYMVDRNATLDNAFTNNPVEQIVPATGKHALGKLIVIDAAGNTRHDNVVAIVISHGFNGHGAFQPSGSRKVTGSTNPNELINCHCTSTGALQTPANGADLYYFKAVMAAEGISSGDGDMTKSFDDIVRYYTRMDFLSTAESRTD